MNDFNDKNDTFIFKPEEEVKPHIDRTESDKYSSARRGVYNKKEEEKISPLIYVAAGLAAVLVVAIIIGLIVLNSDGNKNNANKPQEQQEELKGGETISGEDEEEEDDEIETITYYGLVFNSDRIFMLESEEGYAISADLYDNSDKKVETRRVRITEETEIRDNGQRISMDAFISVIENQGGDKNVFGSEIREEDSVVTYIAYDSRSFEEDIPEGPEVPTEEPTEPENPPEVPTEEPTEPPAPIQGEVDEDSSTTVTQTPTE